MKTTLTKTQSERLIKLGVPKEKASIKYIEEIRIVKSHEVYDWAWQFTLTDLLEMLPKEIENRFCINIDWNFLTETWGVDYDYTEGSFHSAKELIDSLYKLCVWTIENKYLKFE